MLRLCLLALEREENVAVAYNENVLGRRLAALPLSDTARGLIGETLARVWHNEEMHAAYVREALLRLEDPLVNARTFFGQVAGLAGGWAASVRQHKRWSDAPFPRATATLLTWVGAATGRVPQEVRVHLDYCTFQAFCRYNVHTESTAWLCWQRLAELAPHAPALAHGQADDFRRVAHDEVRHRQVFKILAAALTDHDTLRPDVTEEVLCTRLRAVSTVSGPGVTSGGGN